MSEVLLRKCNISAGREMGCLSSLVYVVFFFVLVPPSPPGSLAYSFYSFSLLREWIGLRNMLCSCNCTVRAKLVPSCCPPLWILSGVDRNDDKHSVSLDMKRQSEPQFTILYSLLLELRPARRKSLPRMAQYLCLKIL